MTTKEILKTYWRFTRPYKKLFWLGSLGSVFAVVAGNIVAPLVISKAFSLLQTNYAAHAGLHFGQFAPYIIGLAVALFLEFVIWRLQLLAVWRYEVGVVRDMMIEIFDHLQYQGQHFHANHFSGALVAQATKFTRAYERFMDSFTWNIVTGLTTIVAALIVLLVTSTLYAGIMIGVTAIYIVIMTPLIRKQLPLNVAEAESNSRRTAVLADMITNVASVRSFANEPFEAKRFKEYADDSYERGLDLMRREFKNTSASQSITNSFDLLAFVFGVFAVTSLHQNAGELFLLVSYTGNIVQQLWQFGRVSRNITSSLGDSAEMIEILSTPIEISDASRTARAKISRGAIRFDSVSFGHEKGGKLFANLTFDIKPGEKVGLVGPSGGGKTTLSRLILRFMDIDKGRILIDGQDISKIPQRDLRREIAYVPQEPLLFHRSLADNIRYGELDASDQAVEAIAKMAHAHDFIKDLPVGYETLVGERGVKLSGGQRQRVAIARAMLKNAPILLLDEATSALDSESEALIQDALWKLMENRTAIVIAHRLSTIQKMDRIIVLDGGQIVEQGSHRELVGASGTYAKLWSRQSGGFIES